MAIAREAVALAISEDLDALRLAQGDTVEAFAARAGLSKQTVINILKTDANMTLTSLVKCAIATGHGVRVTFVPLVAPISLDQS